MYNSRESENRYGVKVEQDKSRDNINNKKKEEELLLNLSQTIRRQRYVI